MKYIMTLLAVLAMTACGARPLSPGGDTPQHGVAASLDNLGDWFLWAGSVALVLGVAVRIYSTFNPLLAAFAGIATLIAEIGSCAIAFGLCSIYLSDHAWIFPVAGGIAAVAFAFRYRAVIRRWFRIGTRPVPKASADASVNQ